MDDYVECHAAEHLVYGLVGAFCPCVPDEEIAEWFIYISGEQRQPLPITPSHKVTS